MTRSWSASPTCSSSSNTFTLKVTRRPSMSVRSASARTAIPNSVGAMWRTFTRVPTELCPGFRNGSNSWTAARSTNNTIEGVENTCLPPRTVQRASVTTHTSELVMPGLIVSSSAKSPASTLPKIVWIEDTYRPLRRQGPSQPEAGALDRDVHQLADVLHVLDASGGLDQARDLRRADHAVGQLVHLAPHLIGRHGILD